MLAGVGSGRATLRFLGGTGTVTGSKYLLTFGGKRILIDCGLFQGYKQLRLRNWGAFPVEPASLDAVVLTHAHIDHSGYLPVLARDGFKGPIYCSAATRDLCAILLPDSGHLQEEDARYANKRGFSKHKPALPLYTEEDARRCLPLLRSVNMGEAVDLGVGLAFELIPAGHILGSAMAMVRGPAGAILFSGDLGRPNDLVMHPPTRVAHADDLVIESTYGDRLHAPDDSGLALERIVRRTAARGGIVLVPAFAVGRTQTLLYLIHLLKSSRRIPNLPVFLNSPMATDVTRLYHEHRVEHRLTAQQCEDMCRAARFVNTVAESKGLNDLKMPAIIIAASGMATGGRVLHHLKAFAPDRRNTILFSGFQGGGTRGAAMLAGASTIKIHGREVPVEAEVDMLDTLSAHADWGEIMGWLEGFDTQPRKIFITHGEPSAADGLRQRIADARGWQCHVPDYLEEREIDI